MHVPWVNKTSSRKSQIFTIKLDKNDACERHYSFGSRKTVRLLTNINHFNPKLRWTYIRAWWAPTGPHKLCNPMNFAGKKSSGWDDTIKYWLTFRKVTLLHLRKDSFTIYMAVFLFFRCSLLSKAQNGSKSCSTVWMHFMGWSLDCIIAIKKCVFFYVDQYLWELLDSKLSWIWGRCLGLMNVINANVE